jgi:sortase (surface protein transpeptidase)
MKGMRYTQVMGEKTQKTSKGHEIAVPRRRDVFRDLKKVAKGKRSTPDRAKK